MKFVVNHFVTEKDMDSAYMVACLGATQQDWKVIVSGVQIRKKIAEG